MATKKASTLIKIGNPLLKQKCQEVTFPLSDEINDSVYECIDALVCHFFNVICLQRNIKGFWSGRSFAISAP